MHGVGGKTIAEAQSNLSYPEFMTWVKYRNKRGSLNAGMRVERGTSLLAAMYANAHGNKSTFYDFAPHHEEPAPTLEQAMETWT